MRRKLGVLVASLALGAAPAPAYWIKHCSYQTFWSTQTAMVADLNPGPADAASLIFGFSPHHHLAIAYGGTLYFQADDGQTGAELWRIAGGAPVQVANLGPGPQGSAPHAFALFQHKLFFAASTPATGEELYAFDGTSIALAAELTPGPGGGEIAGLTEHDGALYFARFSATAGHEVWRFDGSTAAPVAAINALPGFVHRGDLVAEPFVVFDGRLFFVLETPLPEHYELWAWDGAGVTQIKALTAGQEITSYGFHLGVHGGDLYFGVVAPAAAPFHQDELWRYDGQGAPVQVAVLPGHAFSFSQPHDFQAHQGDLYFSAGSGGFFRFDGGSVQELATGPGGLPYYAENTTAFAAADRLYFTGFYEDWTGREPHLFDGATAALLENIMPDGAAGYPGSFPSRAVEAGGELYFYAEDEAHGRELWRVSGQGIPILECHVVVAPIWEEWWEWPIDRREVVVATWWLGPGGEERLLSREVVTVERGEEARVRVLELDTRREPVPRGFALATLVFDRETGEVLDRGYDVVGTPEPRLRAALERAAAGVLERGSLQEVMEESR